MADLRDRLRHSDPFRDLPPLDAAEAAEIRRAMRDAAPGRKPVPWRLAAGLTLATAASLAAAVLLLWPSAVEAPPDPEIVRATLLARDLPTLELPPEALAIARPRFEQASPAPPAPPATTQVKEVRFVTANGTQIVWMFRSSEEGA